MLPFAAYMLPEGVPALSYSSSVPATLPDRFPKEREGKEPNHPGRIFRDKSLQGNFLLAQELPHLVFQ